MAVKFKVSFTLDEDDAKYFRSLYRKAKREAKDQDAEKIVKEARGIVSAVRRSKKTPKFVREAIAVLEDLTDLIVDEDWKAPPKVRREVLAGVAYFSNPDDLIPDDIPGLGFLDDAIMIKFIEEEFRHELWGYRKFQKARDISEQRPWSDPGRERLKARLAIDRKKIRKQIATRVAKEAEKATAGGGR